MLKQKKANFHRSSLYINISSDVLMASVSNVQLSMHYIILLLWLGMCTCMYIFVSIIYVYLQWTELIQYHLIFSFNAYWNIW